MRDDSDQFMRVLSAYANYQTSTRARGRQVEPDVRKQKPEAHRMNGRLHEAAVARRKKRKRGGKK